MSRQREILSCISSLALAVVLAGCTQVRRQGLQTSFLPPPPRQAQTALVTPEPPEIEPRADLRRAAPVGGIGQTGGRLGRAEALTQEADFHFQMGRRHYQEGDEQRARSEFDRAVDVLLTAPEDVMPRAALEKKLDELVDAIHLMDLAGLGAGQTGEPSFEKSPLEDIPQQLTFPVDPKLKNKVLEEARATVSQLPLDVNDAVLSYINYFSTERGRRILVSGLRRAGRYKPLIQRILDEEGIPQELIFLAQAESGFLPRAVSRKKATGMWQFMLARGKQYGLERSALTDERLDPEQATRAAARHLRDLYHEYGEWYLAMAAYNCGPGVVDRAVERTGYADFWEFRRRNVLPKETANYVPIILAMTIMVKNAEEYGLTDIDADPPLEYDVVRISSPTNLMLAADLAECPVSQLQELNPALLKNIAPEGWTLRVPRQTGAAVASGLEMVPAEKRASWRAHRIADGESLLTLSRRYRVAENSIVAANGEMDRTLEPGDLVIIPVAAAPAKATPKRASPRRAVRRSPSRQASAGRGAQPTRKAAAIEPVQLSAKSSSRSSVRR